jgi:TolA-binding protein
MPSWLPLLNYSTKYNISLSTLRRRIKARSIEFKLDQGKYLILDSAASTTSQPSAPTPIRENIQVATAATMPKREIKNIQDSNFVEASVLTSANRLVEEIKSAYAKILQEKEEQISQLKEEIVDLRMLVRILEDSSKPATKDATEQKKSDPLPESDSVDYLFGDFQNRDI